MKKYYNKKTTKTKTENRNKKKSKKQCNAIEIFKQTTKQQQQTEKYQLNQNKQESNRQILNTSLQVPGVKESQSNSSSNIVVLYPTTIINISSRSQAIILTFARNYHYSNTAKGSGREGGGIKGRRKKYLKRTI